VNCAICGIRKAKRHCPGISADICTVCCGTEREQTVDCPLGCEYLHDAHDHERIPPVDVRQIPFSEINVTESFLEENQMPLFYLGTAVFEGAMQAGNATDYDVREALESLIRTYKTLETGLYYETRPVNPYAAAIYQKVQTRVEEMRSYQAEQRGGAFQLRDATVLGVLIFLQRLEYTSNNGRKRSRAFLDTLGKFYRDEMKELLDSPEPEAPRIIL